MIMLKMLGRKTNKMWGYIESDANFKIFYSVIDLTAILKLMLICEYSSMSFVI